MAEKPLSVKESVRLKLVSGLQTQHREPMKKQPPEGAKLIYDSLDCYQGEGWAFQYPKSVAGGITYNAIFELPNKGKSRYQVGDRLYLQEPYRIVGWACRRKSERTLCGYYLDGDYESTKGWRLRKKLTVEEYKKWNVRKFPFRKTSGRFMYKSLARHWFEVTEMRAERVQDTTINDIQLEGCPEIIDHRCIKWWRQLWDSCYGEGAWNRNDWVWCYTFRKVDYGK